MKLGVKPKYIDQDDNLLRKDSKILMVDGRDFMMKNKNEFENPSLELRNSKVWSNDII
jgi:hypothetical protein